MSDEQAQPPRQRGLILLVLGAAAGIVLAAVGLGAGSHRAEGLPEGAVARVNGEIIRADEYQRVVEAVDSDRREELGEKQRKQVLDRLIDEELLVQRGLELGFARNDRKVRADLTSAVIASVVGEYDDVTPSDTDLQAFYEKNRQYFAEPPRLRVRQIYFRAGNSAAAEAALKRAQEAVRRLHQGEDFAAVRQSDSDAELAPIPDALLPPAKLRDYIGTTALRTVESLQVGEPSAPVRSGTGYHVLEVVERQDGGVAPLADIKSEVIAEYRRRAGERALRRYLDDLRAGSEIAIAP